MNPKKNIFFSLSKNKIKQNKTHFSKIKNYFFPFFFETKSFPPSLLFSFPTPPTLFLETIFLFFFYKRKGKEGISLTLFDLYQENVLNRKKSCCFDTVVK